MDDERIIRVYSLSEDYFYCLPCCHGHLQDPYFIYIEEDGEGSE